MHGSSRRLSHSSAVHRDHLKQERRPALHHGAVDPHSGLQPHGLDGLRPAVLAVFGVGFVADQVGLKLAVELLGRFPLQLGQVGAHFADLVQQRLAGNYGKV